MKVALNGDRCLSPLFAIGLQLGLLAVSGGLPLFAANGPLSGGSHDIMTTTPQRSNHRPRIYNNTIVTSSGLRLRGGTFWLYGWIPDKIIWAESDGPWNLMRQYDLNVVRLACAYRPMTHPGDTLTLSEYETVLDHLIERAERQGVYAVIDFHDEPGTYQMTHARDFWNRFAPRYAQRQHVIYELTNEPVTWTPSDYTDQNLRDLEELWQICNNHAPDTPIVILTFPHVGSSGATPLEVTNRLQDGGPGEANIIDWEKTLVGFHSYWRLSSERIQELKQHYPVFNTEFMRVAADYDPDDQKPDMMKPMDGYYFHGTLMEELGISWMQWDILDRQNHAAANLPPVINDLIEHGLYWGMRARARPWWLIAP